MLAGPIKTQVAGSGAAATVRFIASGAESEMALLVLPMRGHRFQVEYDVAKPALGSNAPETEPEIVWPETVAAGRRILCTLVGPAFQDVAAKYKSDAQALEKAQTSIGQCGVVKWGAIPMPPMAGLRPAQMKVLAAYVLKP